MRLSHSEIGGWHELVEEKGKQIQLSLLSVSGEVRA